jgi:hypothetical protein
MENKNKKTVNECLKQLSTQTDWIGRFARYADSLIISNSSNYRRRIFRVRKPLTIYTCVDKAQRSTAYDIRYKGQSVGTVKVGKNGKITLSCSPKLDRQGNFYFGWEKNLSDADWHGEYGSKFRRHFYSLSGDEKTKSPEHRIENQMLIELSKTSSQDKLFRNIQPVRLCGCFFQMPTPFKASNHKSGPQYSERGGGIDILARVRHGASDVRLCVCELKDEYTASETEEEVIQQAITYATFIGVLLKSKTKDGKNVTNASKWWELFGFSRPIPEHLNIDVVTVMPTDNNAKPLEEESIDLDGLNVTLNLYSLYFKSNNNGEITHISGSFKNVIDPS